jgi:hypothetical protein
MTPEDQQLEAQSFLTFYIQGSNAPGVESQFPDSFETGMKLRRPALRNIRSEHDDAPLEEGTFEAGEGPEASNERYLFVDQCALQLARVSVEGSALRVRFVFVNRYPAGRFPGREGLTDTVMLPFLNGAASSNMSECLDRLEEYLGASDEFSPVLLPASELLELDDFEARVANGDL